MAKRLASHSLPAAAWRLARAAHARIVAALCERRSLRASEGTTHKLFGQQTTDNRQLFPLFLRRPAPSHLSRRSLRRRRMIHRTRILESQLPCHA